MTSRARGQATQGFCQRWGAIADDGAGGPGHHAVDSETVKPPCGRKEVQQCYCHADAYFAGYADDIRSTASGRKFFVSGGSQLITYNMSVGTHMEETGHWASPAKGKLTLDGPGHGPC